MNYQLNLLVWSQKRPWNEGNIGSSIHFEWDFMDPNGSVDLPKSQQESMKHMHPKQIGNLKLFWR